MTEQQMRDSLVVVVKVLRIHQNRELHLQMQIDALKHVAKRLAPESRMVEHWLAEGEALFRLPTAELQAREQLDALIAMVESGKNPNAPDA